ncbi:hypothetical protein C8R47DRAFT_1072469 [Mycena vitilis]|nr:hypothetical protein C8R47DRAFT_1072469 [Mycena vitilis]
MKDLKRRIDEREGRTGANIAQLLFVLLQPRNRKRASQRQHARSAGLERRSTRTPRAPLSQLRQRTCPIAVRPASRTLLAEACLAPRELRRGRRSPVRTQESSPARHSDAMLASSRRRKSTVNERHARRTKQCTPAAWAAAYTHKGHTSCDPQPAIRTSLEQTHLASAATWRRCNAGTHSVLVARVKPAYARPRRRLSGACSIADAIPPARHAPCAGRDRVGCSLGMRPYAPAPARFFSAASPRTSHPEIPRPCIAGRRTPDCTSGMGKGDGKKKEKGKDGVYRPLRLSETFGCQIEGRWLPLVRSEVPDFALTGSNSGEASPIGARSGGDGSVMARSVISSSLIRPWTHVWAELFTPRCKRKQNGWSLRRREGGKTGEGEKEVKGRDRGSGGGSPKLERASVACVSVTRASTELWLAGHAAPPTFRRACLFSPSSAGGPASSNLLIRASETKERMRFRP